MAKHYLDPKQTEGPRDVEIAPWDIHHAITNKVLSTGYVVAKAPWIVGGLYATEAAALAAARRAAGYETEE